MSTDNTEKHNTKCNYLSGKTSSHLDEAFQVIACGTAAG